MQFTLIATFKIKSNSLKWSCKLIRHEEILSLLKGNNTDNLKNCHYSDVIMNTMASQITSLTIVYSTVHSGAKKTSKLRVTGLGEGNSPVTGELPAQKGQ